MSPDELVEFQQNEIDSAEEAIGERIKHVAGTVDHGLLEGSLLQEHQNDRAEAYLEGYADALEFAAREVECIQNLVGHVQLPEESATLATVVKSLYGANPQAPVSELDAGYLLEQLIDPLGEDVVEDAVEEAGWDPEEVFGRGD